MNIKIIAAAILAISASVSAQAQVYAGATVGASSYNVDCSGNFSCDTKSTAFKVFTGYQVTPLFDVEASYFNMGNISGTDSDLNVQGRAAGIDVAGVMRMQLNQDTGLFARLGMATVKTKVTQSQGTNSMSLTQSSFQPVFGIGATYNVYKTLRVRAEIEARRIQFYNSEPNTVTNFAIGFENAF